MSDSSLGSVDDVQDTSVQVTGRWDQVLPWITAMRFERLETGHRECGLPPAIRDTVYALSTLSK
jgi:hypothetical protein